MGDRMADYLEWRESYLSSSYTLERVGGIEYSGNGYW